MQIDKIFSSPFTRSVETALVFARELNGSAQENPRGYPQICPEIDTDKRLEEGAFTFETLKEIAEKEDSEIVLLSMHGKLYTALPEAIQISLKVKGGSTRMGISVQNL
jgi:broad specificity phosphatase PhoE